MNQEDMESLKEIRPVVIGVIALVYALKFSGGSFNSSIDSLAYEFAEKFVKSWEERLEKNA